MAPEHRLLSLGSPLTFDSNGEQVLPFIENAVVQVERIVQTNWRPYEEHAAGGLLLAHIATMQYSISGSRSPASASLIAAMYSPRTGSGHSTMACPFCFSQMFASKRDHRPLPFRRDECARRGSEGGLPVRSEACRCSPRSGGLPTNNRALPDLRPRQAEV